MKKCQERGHSDHKAGLTPDSGTNLGICSRAVLHIFTGPL